MRAPSPAWLCLMLGLLCLEVRSGEITLKRAHRNRFHLLTKGIKPRTEPSGHSCCMGLSERHSLFPKRSISTQKVEQGTPRLSLSRISKYRHSSYIHTRPDLSLMDSNQIPQEDAPVVGRGLLHKDSSIKLSDPPTRRIHDVFPGPDVVRRRGSRGRRHANSIGGRSHGHLMRVGCVLGTCQVHNLSHRLYQLIGQSGREDSSPINPRSPHSYG
ncbi:uncharacterized protein adm2b [Menidia menidia]